MAAGTLLTRAGEPGDEGQMSLLDGGPRPATVVADTPGRLLVISRRHFAVLLMDAPGLTETLLGPSGQGPIDRPDDAPTLGSWWNGPAARAIAATAIAPGPERNIMRGFGLVIVLVFPLSLLASDFAFAADDAKVKAGMEQVESGAKKIPSSKIGEGVEETAKGIGTSESGR